MTQTDTVSKITMERTSSSHRWYAIREHCRNGTLDRRLSAPRLPRRHSGHRNEKIRCDSGVQPVGIILNELVPDGLLSGEYLIVAPDASGHRSQQLFDRHSHATWSKVASVWFFNSSKLFFVNEGGRDGKVSIFIERRRRFLKKLRLSWKHLGEIYSILCVCLPLRLHRDPLWRYSTRHVNTGSQQINDWKTRSGQEVWSDGGSRVTEVAMCILLLWGEWTVACVSLKYHLFNTDLLDTGHFCFSLLSLEWHYSSISASSKSSLFRTPSWIRSSSRRTDHVSFCSEPGRWKRALRGWTPRWSGRTLSQIRALLSHSWPRRSRHKPDSQHRSG